MSKITKKFQRILVAVDVTGESDLVLQTAYDIAQAFGSELWLVHVVEPISMAYNDNLLVDLSHLEEEMKDGAKAHLRKLGKSCHINLGNQQVLSGRPATEIHAFADKVKADLIVVGTHGKSGISLLLGSTANGVLHGSKCDVLAVRVSPE